FKRRIKSRNGFPSATEITGDPASGSTHETLSAGALETLNPHSLRVRKWYRPEGGPVNGLDGKISPDRRKCRAGGPNEADLPPQLTGFVRSAAFRRSSKPKCKLPKGWTYKLVVILNEV